MANAPPTPCQGQPLESSSPNKTLQQSGGTQMDISSGAKSKLSKLIKVHRSVDGYDLRSWAEARVALSAGSLFAPITGILPSSHQELGTVQAGRDFHVVWNSEMYFVNHSCAPTLEVDWSTMEIRVCRERDLNRGDVLSVFYPSTEWSLDHEFDCWCDVGAQCCGRIRGARDMDRQILKRYWLNGYIQDLLDEAQAQTSGA